MVDSQEPNGSFLKFFLIIFFSNIYIYIYIYIYISGHLSYAKFIVVPKYIIGFFLSRNNISGAINVFRH